MKVVYKDIEQTLDQLSLSTKSLDTIIKQGVFGANSLETTEKMEQLNLSIQEMLQSYKNVLFMNERSTRQSVEFLEDSDSKLAGEMKMFK